MQCSLLASETTVVRGFCWFVDADYSRLDRWCGSHAQDFCRASKLVSNLNIYSGTLQSRRVGNFVWSQARPFRWWCLLTCWLGLSCVNSCLCRSWLHWLLCPLWSSNQRWSAACGHQCFCWFWKHCDPLHPRSLSVWLWFITRSSCHPQKSECSQIRLLGPNGGDPESYGRCLSSCMKSWGSFGSQAGCYCCSTFQLFSPWMKIGQLLPSTWVCMLW